MPSNGKPHAAAHGAARAVGADDIAGAQRLAPAAGFDLDRGRDRRRPRRLRRLLAKRTCACGDLLKLLEQRLRQLPLLALQPIGMAGFALEHRQIEHRAVAGRDAAGSASAGIAGRAPACAPVTPSGSSMSSVGGWKVEARRSRTIAASASTTVTGMLCSASSSARHRPTGPPPADDDLGVAGAGDRGAAAIGMWKREACHIATIASLSRALSTACQQMQWTCAQRLNA